MVLMAACASLLSPQVQTRASTAYGDLNNFDVINDTGDRCYGFEIELDDVRSTDVTYTFDWNHFGVPRITEDLSDPLHPRVFVRYQSVRNSDGTFASFTNPQDPANPIAPTDGHSCVDVSVNRGCEHFGVGYYGSPSRVIYRWLVQDPLSPGTLMGGPLVNVATPQFVYYPAVPPPVLPGDPPAAPAQVVVVIEPPEPVEAGPDQFGVPVWVKVLKTVQPGGRKVELADLMSDDQEREDDEHWAGQEQPETEIEWMVFQKRPASNPGGDEIVGADDLPEGDETVVRRYEFYVYNGPTNPEDGEAQCDNPDSCPDAVGAYIGAQMAGFNVEAPFGLIDHLQSGEVGVPYVDRSMVVGGNSPYHVVLGSGAIPDGLVVDEATGVISGVPERAGIFLFELQASDADGVTASKSYTVTVVDPLVFSTQALPSGQEGSAYQQALQATGGVAPYRWEAGALPGGLQLTRAGVIQGTPEAGTAGTYAVTVVVEDAEDRRVEATLQMTVAPVLRPEVRGDIDRDGDVDITDLSLVLAARNRPATGPGDARDLDHNGVINILDARILAALLARR